MLEELRITGLGVIADAVLDLSPGFTVVTGETGAGKTMLLHGLSLLCGGKADPAVVRAGAPGGRAVVEGRWLVADGGPVAARAQEAGAELDDGALIAVRTVASEGRSRAHLGGRAVPTALLAETAADLVAVHGQSDQQRLVRPGVQRAALDRFAGEPVATLLADYREVHRRFEATAALRERLVAQERERQREAELLRAGLAEIDAVAPVEGEDAALAAEASRLDNADALRAAADTAHAALTGDPATETEAGDALTAVVAARRALDAQRSADPALADLADRVGEVAVLLTEAAADLSSYAASVDADPGRLAEVQDRRARLTGLLRRLPLAPSAGGPAGVADALAWAESAQRRLRELDADDERLGGLDDELAEQTAELAAAGARLSAERRAAAARFEAAVSEELSGLAMPAAKVSARVAPRPAGASGPVLTVDGVACSAGPDGLDEVELLLTPHPGAPERPLGRGASGGELSRVMLAVEVVFAGTDPVPLLVFDEVDAGVGGKAAVEIGRRLARLARDHQVVVVTHLPQVAAFADRHVVVRKASTGEVTTSGITTLDDAGRVEELSRMLAGLDDSAVGRAHAEELLTVAAAARVAPAPGARERRPPAATVPARAAS